MLQELVARSLSVPIGAYVHFAGSLHLYEKNVPDAAAFLDEGWQSTRSQMPEMPRGDQWAAVQNLVHTEGLLRAGAELSSVTLDDEPYWADISRLFAIHALIKRQKVGDVAAIGELMHDEIYDVFIQDKIKSMTR
jgi:thymidylate synthase